VLYDTLTHSGPVPLYFAPDSLAAANSLRENPAIAHEITRIVNQRIIKMEYMSVLESEAYLVKKRKPRPKGRPIFEHVWLGPPACVTRTHEETAGRAESGMQICLCCFDT